MATRVQRWGNSLGIRIPRNVAEQLELRDGTEVELQASGGVLTVRPRRQRPTLASLLAQMQPRHRHGELHRDEPRGGELI